MCRPGLAKAGERDRDGHVAATADAQPGLGEQILDDAGVAAGQRRGGAGRRRRQGAEPLEQAFGLAALRIAPDPDRDLAAGEHPGQLGDGRRGLGGVLDRVERSDDVKRRLPEGQLLDVADPQIRRRRALPGDGKQFWRRIHPGHGCAAAGGA